MTPRESERFELEDGSWSSCAHRSQLEFSKKKKKTSSEIMNKVEREKRGNETKTKEKC